MGELTRIQEVSQKLGMVPPQDVPMEESVLGALLLERYSITRVIDILKPWVFYKDPHRLIFEAISELVSDNEPVDMRTVVSRLRKNGNIKVVGGAFKIAELTQGMTSADNIESHSRILIEMAMKRELIKISSEVQTRCYTDTEDVFDIFGKAETDISSILDQNTRGTYEHISESMHSTIQKMHDSKNMELTGVTTGFKSLDKITSGWHSTELIIIAARPGMGKTAMVVSSMLKMAHAGEKVAMFSLEMSKFQLNQRILSSESGIPLDKVTHPRKLEDYEWNRLEDTKDKLKPLGLYVDDTHSLSIIELRAKARRLKTQLKITVLIIDYLQLMSGSGKKGQNREGEISEISRGLKGIAKELEIPVIALSQLSRAVESRGGDKRPMLSDLRESGSIEQDADVVGFLYRPEYYKVKETEAGMSLLGKGEVIIAKQRQGALESVFLKFVGWLTKWEDDPEELKKIEDKEKEEAEKPIPELTF